MSTLASGSIKLGLVLGGFFGLLSGHASCGWQRNRQYWIVNERRNHDEWLVGFYSHM